MMNNINQIEMRSTNPIHHNDDIDFNDHDENNSLITNKNIMKSNKWSLMKKTIFSIVTGIIVITIIDAILMSLNKFVKVDVERVDLYFKPQVLEYGDAQISVKSRTTLLSFLHSAQIQPEASSCLFNLFRENKNYFLTKATLKSKMNLKSSSFGSNTATLDIGWSDFDYATLQDMVVDNPNYANAQLSVNCNINYDVYAFSLIPVKNNHYQYNSADSPESFNIRDTLKTIFETGNVGTNNRRLLESFSLPLQFYNYSFLPDSTNSINQFGFKASTKIDSSKSNIPFQVGVHLPALQLILGHSIYDNQTNTNQYVSSYVFESDETNVDLINSEGSTAFFKAKVNCHMNGTTCSLIYPLSSMFASIENGTAMATADFINDKNFISNFLGISHKMIYKSYEDSSASRSLLESNKEDFTETSRSLTLKKRTVPSNKPSPHPSKSPTLHPTRLVLPSWSNYVHSIIVFDNWELFQMSLFYTDISARLKLNVGVENYKLVTADVQLAWTNEIPLVTSSHVYIDILDGLLIGEQDLFLNELDEIITNEVSLNVDSESVLNVKMGGKYSNLNHDKSVSDSFIIQFHDIDIVLSNETAAAVTNITVKATADGYMAIDFKLISQDEVAVFTGFQWCFDNVSPQNYLGIRSIGSFVNLNPSWDGETYFAYDPSLGSTDDPRAYSYYFNVDGLASSTSTTAEVTEKKYCSVNINLGQDYWNWYLPSDYEYYRLEQVLYETLVRENINVARSDIVNTDINNCYWCRSPTSSRYNVYLSPEDSCFNIKKALQDNALFYNQYLRYQINYNFGPLNTVYIDDYGVITSFNTVSNVVKKPFNYFSRGEGLFGVDEATRFDIVMLQNSIKVDSSTLASFEGVVSADLNSNGFLNLAFTEYNDGHFTFNTTNDFTWDLTSTEGGIGMNSTGSLWHAFDWNFDGEFKYQPNEDKNEYSLDFDLSGNTFSTQWDYKPKMYCSASLWLNFYGSSPDENRIKIAFANAYDDISGIDDLTVKFGYSYSTLFNYDFYSWKYYGHYYDQWSLNSYRASNSQVSLSITIPVKSEMECSYINFKLDKNKFARDAGLSPYIYFYPYSNWESHDEMINNPYHISKSINGNYYDGNSDVILTVSHAGLTINGNNYDYDGSILRDGDSVFVGIKWMDQLQSYLQLGWSIDDVTEGGSLSMEATTLLKNSFDIVDIASNGSLTFEYTKADDLTQFSLVSAVEGHGVDYYKNKYSYGYWNYNKEILTCKWKVVGVDDRLSTYSNTELTSALKYMVNGYLNQQNGNFLFVDSVSVDNYNDFYSIDFFIKPKSNVPNFYCESLSMYVNNNALLFENLINYFTVEVDDGNSNSTVGNSTVTYGNRELATDDARELYYFSQPNPWNANYLFTAYVDNGYQSACAAGSWVQSEGVYSRYQCQQCGYCNYYFDYGWWTWVCGYVTYDCNCGYVYDYYYSCTSWNYVEFKPEETAHTVSFNIEATSHGIVAGNVPDNSNWYCEVQQATLMVNGAKAIDADAIFYNLLPTVEPTSAPSNSMQPTNRPTISPYLYKVSPTKKPTKKPTFSPTVSPTPFPTLTPTLGGTRYGDHIVIFNFNDKQNDIDIGTYGSYHGSSNDFSLILKEFSVKVGNTVITENEIGGKISYKIDSNGETGKILIGSWDDNGDTIIFNNTNSVEWLVKDKKFYIGLESSFTINDINLFDASLNSSVVQSPSDLLLGVGNALSVEDSKIYDVSAVTQWYNYDNRPDKPTYKPTKKPTRKPTRKPTKKPTTTKPSRQPTHKPTNSWIKVPRPTKNPTKKPSGVVRTDDEPTGQEVKTRYPTRKRRPHRKPTYSHRFPNIAPSRRYVYRTHSPTKKPSK